MFNPINRNRQRKVRHRRMRFYLKGTSERPRLNVFRSNKQIYAQVIDDTKSITIASASSLKLGIGANLEGAKAVGKLVAEKAIENGVKKVVFDRGGYLYHGRVKALADAAREAGLEF